MGHASEDVERRGEICGPSSCRQGIAPHLSRPALKICRRGICVENIDHTFDVAGVGESVDASLEDAPIDDFPQVRCGDHVCGEM